MEIEAFRAQEYWTVSAQLRTPRGKEFTARLVTHAGKRWRSSTSQPGRAELAVEAVRHRDLAWPSSRPSPPRATPRPPS
jgi:DNA topoisomerase-1